MLPDFKNGTGFLLKPVSLVVIEPIGLKLTCVSHFGLLTMGPWSSARRWCQGVGKGWSVTIIHKDNVRESQAPQPVCAIFYYCVFTIIHCILLVFVIFPLVKPNLRWSEQQMLNGASVFQADIRCKNSLIFQAAV